MEMLRLLDWVPVLKGTLVVFSGLLLLVFLFFLFKAVGRAVLSLTRDRRRSTLAVLMILASFLIVVSVVSYSAEDYGKLGVETPRNLGGISGVLVSTYLLRTFGFACYFVPVLLFWAGVHLLRGGTVEKLLRPVGLVTCLALFVSLLLSLLGLPQLGPAFTTGGIVGEAVIRFLKTYTGVPGAWVISFFFLLVTLVLFTELSLGGLIPGLSGGFRKIGQRRRERKEKGEATEIKVERPRKAKPVATVTAPADGKVSASPRPVKRAAGTVPAGIDKDFQAQFLELLETPSGQKVVQDGEELKRNCEILEEKLRDFGVLGQIVEVAPGPVITRYEFEPAAGVRVSSIAALADDLALAMKASRIRIEAPVPGKAAVGIEVPNSDRDFVYLKEVLTADSFSSSKSRLAFALGKDIGGEPDCADIASMPHLLIAGATGSGKSVCINSLVASILYRAEPADVRFIMIDPKMLELPVYNSIPHLLKPVITNAKESVETLKEVVALMETRYQEFARAGVRDIEGYNQKMDRKKPYVLIIVDELADLMITAPGEIEAILTRLAQMSRAVGIHLILATQRPSVDVITGLIKANFPARIAFQVASGTDSRTILDMGGAEKLLGRGDMLFLPPGKGTPVRLHGAYISTEEAKRIASLWGSIHLTHLLEREFDPAHPVVDKIIEEDLVDSIVARRKTPGSEERLRRFSEEVEEELSIPAETVYAVLTGTDYYPPITEELLQGRTREDEGEGGFDGVDELFDEAKTLVIRHQVASVSLLQRRLKIGYARAGRIIDQLERAGIVGPYVGSKSREVLVQDEEVIDV